MSIGKKFREEQNPQFVTRKATFAFCSCVSNLWNIIQHVVFLSYSIELLPKIGYVFLICGYFTNYCCITNLPEDHAFTRYVQFSFSDSSSISILTSGELSPSCCFIFNF
jgi:hypothetical protein